VFWRYLRATSAFWFALIAAASGLAVTSAAVWSLADSRERMLHSVSATATVGGKRTARTFFGFPVFLVDFRYQDAFARRREGYLHVRAAEYEGYQPGQPLRIRILPGGGIQKLSEVPTPLSAWAIALLGAAAFLAGAIGLWRLLRDVRARVISLSYGQPAIGIVVQILTGGSLAERSHCRICWTWYGPDGKPHRRTSPLLSPRRAGRWHPGDQIAIFLHPADPDRAEADVYGFRAPVP
jgi:hypothetical protein